MSIASTARTTLLISALALLSACGGAQTVSRALPLADPVPVAARQPAYSVAALQVSVPETLSVSEANSYYPLADIVWHGEPRGNRHAQVAEIFREGLSRGTDGISGTGPEVVLGVTVRRFHALTPRARFTVGGVHGISFELTLRDAETGAVLDGPRAVDASLKALGGARALEAERDGITQKTRITAHLAEVIRRELGRARLPGAIAGHGPQPGAAAGQARDI